MDFNSFVNSFYSPAGVLSVEKKEDGCGEVRFVTGNDKFTGIVLSLAMDNPVFETKENISFVTFSIY